MERREKILNIRKEDPQKSFFDDSLRSESRWWIVVIMTSALSWLYYEPAHAQLVSSNPLEYVALAEGNDLINTQIKAQIEEQQKTALFQNAIAAEFSQIHQWEQKYNKYLKDISGFASSLKACSSLYDDGVRIFINLCHLKKAISGNPRGMVATMSLNNLYVETATELVTVYMTLKEAVAKGGKDNMLTGAERSKTLWTLNDRLDAFNKKLSRLCLSIRYYTLTDVWNSVTAGMLDKTPGEVASESYHRWRRCAKATMP